RTYAARVLDGSAFTWEIPSTVAGTIEAIAARMEAKSAPALPREQDTYHWGETMKQYAVLGIGAEAWVELEEIERRGIKHRNNDQSGMSISWRTFRLVMTVLRAIRLQDFRDAQPPPA